MPRTTKRLPLVCQHLENSSRDALETYLDVIRDYVRYQAGISGNMSAPGDWLRLSELRK